MRETSEESELVVLSESAQQSTIKIDQWPDACVLLLRVFGCFSFTVQPMAPRQLSMPNVAGTCFLLFVLFRQHPLLSLSPLSCQVLLGTQ